MAPLGQKKRPFRAPKVMMYEGTLVLNVLKFD